MRRRREKFLGLFFLYNIFAIFFYVFHIFTSKLSFYTIWSNGIILQPQKQTREKVIVGIFESKKVTESDGRGGGGRRKWQKMMALAREALRGLFPP